VVPSPAASADFEATSRTIWAPMFSNLSSSSISFATVTPSLVMRGAPNDLSSTTLRPTRADGDDFALRGLFLGAVRNDDAALGLFFGVDALDHNAVVKRTEFQEILLNL
jgi:hypothetical protein